MILVNGRRLPIAKFPDGTPKMLNLNSLFPEPARADFTLYWRFEGVEEQVYLYNIVQHIRDNLQPLQMVLFMPYMPNARMDRQKDFIGEVHTLKYFCKFINDLNFDAVYVLDPHSDVTSTLLNHVVVCSSKPYVDEVIAEYKPDVLFFPDRGAYKRYGNEDYGDIPRLYGEKVRDWKSGEILDYRIINPAEGSFELSAKTRVLIIDDLCSYGGTFMAAAKELKKKGNPTIALWITHCEENIHNGHIFEPNSPIDHVYTTDSLLQNDMAPNLTVTKLIKEED